MSKHNTKVISAFPATGKSWLTEELNTKGLTALDSDSSKFSWVSEGVRNPDFPNNYILHIKENIGKVDYIFVSSHKEVRDAMNNNLIPYIVIYPHASLYEEYIDRFIKRGNTKEFISFISQRWYSFINELKNENCFLKIPLTTGQYISDVLSIIDKH